MLLRISILCCFILQIFLTFQGVNYFGKYWNPFCLLLSSAAVGLIWWFSLRKETIPNKDATDYKIKWETGISGAGLAMLGLMMTYPGLSKRFHQYDPPIKYSDVLPQLQTQFQRFVHGEFPYQPVDIGTHIAYPVYLPLHWLPAGLNEDVRWNGFFALLVAVGLMGFFIFQKTIPLGERALSLITPVLVLWGFNKWGGMDLATSFELIIAAYYLVLAIGLSLKDWRWITVGLVFCLLSRYTLVFWLPLFALIFALEESKRKNLLLWGVVIICVLSLYVLPFLSHSPDILSKGLVYHNNAAIAEWVGYGEPPVSWSMERGIHFALHMRDLFKGHETGHQVYLSRVIQASMMFLLLCVGIFVYRKTRSRISAYDTALLMLYLTVLCFYAFGPLTYRYYMVVPLMLSALITSRTMTMKLGRNE